MNKKTLIIVNITVLVFIVGGFIFWKLSQKTPVVNNPVTQNPSTQTPTKNTNQQTTAPIVQQGETATTTEETPQTTTSDKITIKTMSGDRIKVVDFYQNPYTQIFDPQNDAVIKEGANYSIVYYVKDQSFTITLLGGDLPTTRNEAENAFLEKLGISKEEACQFYVTLGVPFFVSEKASGTDYGLSFCPKSIALPKNL